MKNPVNTEPAATFDGVVKLAQSLLGPPRMTHGESGRWAARWWGLSGRDAGSLEVCLSRSGCLEMAAIRAGSDGAVETWVLVDPNAAVLREAWRRFFPRTPWAEKPIVGAAQALEEALRWLVEDGCVLTPDGAS